MSHKYKSMKNAGLFITNGFLWIIEMGLKVIAPVGAAITLGAGGTFFEKLGTGFASLPQTIRRLFETIGQSDYVLDVINDYNTLTAAAFNQKYGSGAINYVMEYLNGAVRYVQNVYQNLSSEPVATLFAVIVVFLMLYLSGRTARFIRQRGQGSILDRMERKTGEKFFGAANEENDF